MWIVWHDSGSLIGWRYASIVLLSAQGMHEAEGAGDDPYFRDDGFSTLEGQRASGRPPKFTPPQRGHVNHRARCASDD